jgi:plastocyanin
MNRLPFLRILLVAVLGLGTAFGVAACGDDDDAGESSGQRIDLSVSDQGFDPAEIQASAGELRLEVTNNGDSPHAVVVEGDAGEVDRFNENLDPGETRTLRITVDSGTYDFYDPNNPDLRGVLTVSGGTATQTETLTQTETVVPPTETQTETVAPPTETQTETEVETQTVPAPTEDPTEVPEAETAP